jgi:hypothetical protein
MGTSTTQTLTKLLYDDITSTYDNTNWFTTPKKEKKKEKKKKSYRSFSMNPQRKGS